MLQTALMVSAGIHFGQTRKNTGLPYIVHPVAVMEIVSLYSLDEDVLTATVLHDSIEDCNYTYEMLVRNFNERVAGLVVELTNIRLDKSIPRHIRKQADKARLETISKEAKLVKLADTKHNVLCMIRENADPDYKQTFFLEKLDLIPVLEEGCPELYQELKVLLEWELRP